MQEESASSLKREMQELEHFLLMHSKILQPEGEIERETSAGKTSKVASYSL